MAPVCLRGRAVAVVSLASELYPLYDICNFGRVLENVEPKGFKTTWKRGNQAGANISSIRLLPRAPVCFRGRLVSVVSLVSELYTL